MREENQLLVFTKLNNEWHRSFVNDVMEIARELSLEIEVVDIDTTDGLLRMRMLGVEFIPTIVVNRSVHMIGVRSREELKKKIEEYINKRES